MTTWDLFTFNFEKSMTVKRFLYRASVLCIIFYSVTLVCSFLFGWAVDWKRWQNPRDRLLYEPITSAVDIVIIGDSVFVSGFVDSENDSIWMVLHRLTGKRVFNASLNGADVPDFLNVVKLLPRQEEKKVVVFLNVAPSRFFYRRTPTRANYAGEFSWLVSDSLGRKGLILLKKPLILLNRDIMLNCLVRPKFFPSGHNYDRIWSKDGDLALNRFRQFEQITIDTDKLKPFDWINDAAISMRSKGYLPVICATPVNTFLISKYASDIDADRYVTQFDSAHRALIQYLQRNKIEYIDGYNQFDSDSFADLIHMNSRGDRHMAEMMAQYIASISSDAAEKSDR
jgi:hypothetical protein